MSGTLNKEANSLFADIKLRMADIKDLNVLVDICRQCFPEYFRWQSFYPIADRWWQTVITSKSCIIIVLEDSLGVFALNVTVFDFALWRAESKRRMGTLLERTLAVLCSRHLAVWIRLLRKAYLQLTSKKPTRSKVIRKNQKHIAWSELTAVLPRMRNRELGGLMLRERNRLALIEGFSHIQTHIESENIASRRMYEKSGYKLISEDSRGCIYEASLGNNTDSNKILSS